MSEDVKNTETHVKTQFTLGKKYGNHLMYVIPVGETKINGKEGFTVDRYTIHEDGTSSKDAALFFEFKFITVEQMIYYGRKEITPQQST